MACGKKIMFGAYLVVGSAVCIILVTLLSISIAHLELNPAIAESNITRNSSVIPDDPVDDIKPAKKRRYVKAPKMPPINGSKKYQASKCFLKDCI